MKEPEILFGHILDCIRQIRKYTKNSSLPEFKATEWMQDAVIRRLEIIGEAVKNLPSEIKETHDDIPWRKIAGLRDVLIHDYFNVDLDLTWTIVTVDLPLLGKRIIQIKKGMKGLS